MALKYLNLRRFRYSPSDLDPDGMMVRFPFRSLQSSPEELSFLTSPSFHIPDPPRPPKFRKAKDLTEGPLFPHMLRMALPMMIGMTSHMFLNIIDGIYVSRLGMEESLAVLNYGFPFFYMIFAVFNGLTSGT